MGETRSSILLVDNDVSSRSVTGRVLRGAGYGVREAGTTAEALAAIAMAPPDLVVLDIRLPTLGGAAVLARIKANPATAGTPVMHLSASFADDRSVAAGLEEGADAYLTKPVSPAVLLATVKALLRMGRAQKELQTANRRLQTLLDTLPVGVSIAEDAECRTITTNAAGAALFEAGPEQNISASAPVPERPAYQRTSCRCKWPYARIARSRRPMWSSQWAAGGTGSHAPLPHPCMAPMAPSSAG
jgi:CheY-like chemotaxis protein